MDIHPFNGAVSLGLRGAAALGRVADAESDDPEERKRQQEALQAASNLGAVIGLTAALVGTLQADNKKQKQEEARIQEEEEYQEFLAQMEAEHKHEEQNWQQTM